MDSDTLKTGLKRSTRRDVKQGISYGNEQLDKFLQSSLSVILRPSSI